MSSLVSSEHAFSQGGITISKCRNQLKGDIVEALQCIKSGIQHDLLLREPMPSSRLEAKEHDKEVEDSKGNSGSPEELDIEDFSWDTLLIEDEDKGVTTGWSE
jgi:hAT family protein